MADLLIPQEKYLESGVHIGTRVKTPHMKKYIYKVREDGLYVLDLKKLDGKIKLAAKLLARFEPQDVLVVATRTFAQQNAAIFCDVMGCRFMGGRFMPGTFTNPKSQYFNEPKIILVADPRTERQAVREATVIGVPVIAFCDTDNLATNVDLIVPCNNKGKKSLAIVFYLICSEILKAKGKDVISYEDFIKKVDERAEAEREKKKKGKKSPDGSDESAEGGISEAAPDINEGDQKEGKEGGSESKAPSDSKTEETKEEGGKEEKKEEEKTKEESPPAAGQ